MDVKGFIYSTFAIVCCNFAIFSTAGAITIDDFQDFQVSKATGSGASTSTVLSTTGALGGTRAMLAEVTNSPGPFFTVTAATISGSYAHSQDTNITGSTIVTWDGDDVADNLNAGGLAGFDLTRDGSDGFIVEVEAFDFPNSTPVTITLTVFDASDITGQSFVTGSTTLDSQILSPINFQVPFSSFTSTGSASSATFKNVGAIRMSVLGVTTAIDLLVGPLRTNGTCPQGIDQCGVCGGDGTSCLDCAGNLNGGLVVDQCGVCGGDNSSCAGCDGVPNSGLEVDECGDCGGNSDTCLGCDGVPNSGLVIDRCGVCGGNGIGCDTCDDLPDSGNYYDVCGVCGGDGTSCLDCEGNLYGEKKPDQCGVCGGDGTSCLDCAGNVNGGLEEDECGVCGGDGTTCLDCSGTPHGELELDQCSVCGGDGRSCLQCTDTNITLDQAALDAGVKFQEQHLLRLLRKLKRALKRKSLKRWVEKTKKEAHDRQIRAWTLSWMLPSVISVCENAFTCTTVDNSIILDEYLEHTTRLFDLTNQAIKTVSKEKRRKSGKKPAKFQKREIARAKRLYRANTDRAEKVPLTHHDCGN